MNKQLKKNKLEATTCPILESLVGRIVPVFHVAGHNTACQLEYGPNVIRG